ncbi:hypothetical protein MRX96_040019 [Rhipicephalus microplus]
MPEQRRDVGCGRLCDCTRLARLLGPRRPLIGVVVSRGYASYTSHASAATPSPVSKETIICVRLIGASSVCVWDM